MKPMPLLKRLEFEGPYAKNSTLFLLIPGELLKSVLPKCNSILPTTDSPYMPNNLNYPMV